jgi:hypothetical protein
MALRRSTNDFTAKMSLSNPYLRVDDSMDNLQHDLRQKGSDMAQGADGIVTALAGAAVGLAQHQSRGSHGSGNIVVDDGWYKW